MIPSSHVARHLSRGAGRLATRRSSGISTSAGRILSAATLELATPSFQRDLHESLQERADPFAAFSTQSILDNIQSKAPQPSVKNSTKEDTDISDAAISLITRGLDDPYLIPPSVLAIVADHAFNARLPIVLRSTIKYALSRLNAELDAHPTLSRDSRDLLLRLISVSSHDVRYNGELLLRLLEVSMLDESTLQEEIHTSMALELPTIAQIGVLRACLLHSELPRFLPLLDVLIPSILEKSPTQSSQDASGVGSWTLYRVVLELMKCRLHNKALEVFSLLVNHHRLPSGAVTGLDGIGASILDSVPNAFEFVTMSSIGRACHLNGWYVRHQGMVQRILESVDEDSTQAETDLASLLVHRLAMDLVNEGTSNSLRSAATVFTSLIRNPHIQPPSRVMLNALYDALQGSDMPALVLELFELVEDLKLEGKAPRRYPWPSYGLLPPSICLSLITHAKRSREKSSLRGLAESYARSASSVPLDPLLIPNIVEGFARHGYIDEAVDMWKAFRDRDGGEMIVGNGGVTIALVSGLTRRGLRNVNQEHRILALKGLNTDLPDKDFLSPSDRQDIATAGDITATFTALHEPAEMASHHNLNSVARANFLVGEVDTALKAFKCLLDRREIPDAHDLAVMVSGIAAFDVELADSALQNATSRGVVMPVQAWTAVLKAAFEGGNLKQADSVLRRMTEAGVKSDLGVIDVILRYGLSEETWGSMLKIEHTTKLSTRKKPREEAVIQYLEMTTGVLLKEQHYPRELTVMCINWVIKCDLPRQAFSFWFEMWKKFDGRPTSPMLKKRSAMDRCMNSMARALVSKYLAGKADYTYAQGRDMCSRLGCRSYWDQKVRGPLGDEPKQSITSQ